MAVHEHDVAELPGRSGAEHSQPTLLGELPSHGLGRLLLGVAERRLTGRLLLHGTDTERVVFFAAGYPIFAQSSRKDERLGVLAVRSGAIDEAALAQALVHAQVRDTQLGVAMLDLAMLDGGQLFALLGLQLRTQLAAGCLEPAQRAVFVSDSHAPDHVTVLHMHPMTPVLAAVDALSESERMALVLTSGQLFVTTTDLSAPPSVWLRDLGYGAVPSALLNVRLPVTTLFVRLAARISSLALDACDPSAVPMASALRADADGNRTGDPLPAAQELAERTVLALLLAGALKSVATQGEQDVVNPATDGGIDRVAAIRSILSSDDHLSDRLPPVVAKGPAIVGHAVYHYLFASRESELAARMAVWGAAAEVAGIESNVNDLLMFYLTLKPEVRPGRVLAFDEEATLETGPRNHADYRGFFDSLHTGDAEPLLDAKIAELGVHLDWALSALRDEAAGGADPTTVGDSTEVRAHSDIAPAGSTVANQAAGAADPTVVGDSTGARPRSEVLPGGSAAADGLAEVVEVMDAAGPSAKAGVRTGLDFAPVASGAAGVPETMEPTGDSAPIGDSAPAGDGTPSEVAVAGSTAAGVSAVIAALGAPPRRGERDPAVAEQARPATPPTDDGRVVAGVAELAPELAPARDSPGVDESHIRGIPQQEAPAQEMSAATTPRPYSVPTAAPGGGPLPSDGEPADVRPDTPAAQATLLATPASEDQTPPAGSSAADDQAIDPGPHTPDAPVTNAAEVAADLDALPVHGAARPPQSEAQTPAAAQPNDGAVRTEEAGGAEGTVSAVSKGATTWGLLSAPSGAPNAISSKDRHPGRAQPTPAPGPDASRSSSVRRSARDARIAAAGVIAVLALGALGWWGVAQFVSGREAPASAPSARQSTPPEKVVAGHERGTVEGTAGSGSAISIGSVPTQQPPNTGAAPARQAQGSPADKPGAPPAVASAVSHRTSSDSPRRAHDRSRSESTRKPTELSSEAHAKVVEQDPAEARRKLRRARRRRRAAASAVVPEKLPSEKRSADETPAPASTLAPPPSVPSTVRRGDPSPPSAREPAPRSRPIKTRIVGFRLEGSPGSVAVARSIARARGGFAACYGHAARKAGKQRYGRASVQVVVDPRGRVILPRVVGAPLPGLNECIAKIATQIKTRPQPGLSRVRAKWTIEYAPR